MQLMELDTPMVLALNMMDEMRGNGGTVRINKMEAMLGIPVVPISAAKNEGVDELVDHALHVAKYQERPGRMDFCSEEDHGGAVHRCIHGIIHLIEDHAEAAGIPVRFAATKLVEGDQRIEAALKLDQNEKEMIEHIIVQMEQERGLDRAAAIADMRFHFIHQLVEQTVVKPRQSKEQLRSAQIDRFLTGRYTAIPAFVGIMALVFYLTFGVIGLALQNLLEVGIDALTAAVDSTLTVWNVNAAVHSLVIDGIFTGVGSVLSFLPIIVTLFSMPFLLEKEEAFEELLATTVPLEQAMLCAEAEPADSSFHLAADGSLSIKATISLQGMLYPATQQTGLSEITVDENRKRTRDSDCALRLYYGTVGESVWEIAKRCNTKVSAIAAENDLSGDTLTKPGMLFIPIVS